eukprot:2572467-Rhodomonas_salina.3
MCSQGGRTRYWTAANAAKQNKEVLGGTEGLTSHFESSTSYSVMVPAGSGTTNLRTGHGTVNEQDGRVSATSEKVGGVRSHSCVGGLPSAACQDPRSLQIVRLIFHDSAGHRMANV